MSKKKHKLILPTHRWKLIRVLLRTEYAHSSQKTKQAYISNLLRVRLHSFSLIDLNVFSYNQEVKKKNYMMLYYQIFLKKVSFYTNYLGFCYYKHSYVSSIDWLHEFYLNIHICFDEIRLFKKKLRLYKLFDKKFTKDLLFFRHFTTSNISAPKLDFFLKNFFKINQSYDFNPVVGRKCLANYGFVNNPNWVKKKFKKKISRKKKKRTFFLSYLYSFLESFFEKPIFLKIKNLNKKRIRKKYRRFVNYTVRKLFKFRFRLGKNIYLKDAIEIFIILARSKDLDFFMRWFILTAEKFNLRSQKKFFFFIRSSFKNYLRVLLKKHGCFGFFLDIRGKVGVKGNAKKRHFTVKQGQLSSTNKNLRLALKQGLINTETGVLGVTSMISF